MQDEYPLGLRMEPSKHKDYSVEAILGADQELPEQYIVDYYRGWFDDDFNVIPEKVGPVRNQGAIDSCVGQASAVQKSAHEGDEMSARDSWRQAKRADGYPLSAYGTTLVAGQDSLVKGIATEKTVHEDHTGGRSKYMSVDDVNEQVREEREEHAGKSFYFVGRDRFKQTIFQTKQPIVTGCRWTRNDNNIGRNGADPRMKTPVSDQVGGHAFACIGWIVYEGQECLVMVNSWSRNWGWHGMFLVPTNQVTMRLYMGYVHVDLPQDLGKLLQQYNGKDVSVPGKPEIYRIQNGKKHHYEDEIVWWSFGNLFHYKIYDITEENLNIIPDGGKMDIEDAPFETRELVRQIRGFYGKN